MQGSHNPGMRRRPMILLGLWAAGVLCLLACPPTETRNPSLSVTQYRLGQDYFNRAVASDNAEVRERYLGVAMTELRKATSADDTNQEAQSLIGLLYLIKGQHVVDEVEIQQCLRPGEATEFRKEIDQWMKKARMHFQKALELKPRDSAVAFNLSTVYLYFKDYVKAEASARRALEDISYPTPHLARNNIGRAQLEQGKHARALKNLRHAVFSQRRFCPGHYWLGRVQLALNSYEEAITAFKESLECCRNEKIAPILEAHYYLALAFFKVGQPANARLALEQCVKQAPKSCVARQCATNLKTGSRP
jgi:Tfp pilus assembly protein PilF